MLVDHAELEVHFQPEFSLVDGTILGVEALLRWEHPVRGRVPADEFILVAEQSGLITEIGRFALHAACREFAAIVRDLGYELRRAFDPAAVKAALGTDKKRMRGRQHWILPLDIGHVIDVDDVSEAELDAAIAHIHAEGRR